MVETQLPKPGQAAVSPAMIPEKRAETSQPQPEIKTERPTMGALHKIRQQMASQNQSGKKSSVELTDASLAEAWQLYIQKLTEAKNHTTAANLKLAECVITGEYTFDIFTDTIIQQRFIEQERGGLIDHLHQFFNNRLITYQVMIKAPSEEATPADRPLNKREQFLKMIEEYPLIKDLKDKLNLDLE
jgi:DNA polymerase-3 subunit gamma/tau